MHRLQLSVPGVVMKHYQANSPPPAWWKKVRDLYAGAMDEMYRGQQRSMWRPAVHALSRQATGVRGRVSQ